MSNLRISVYNTRGQGLRLLNAEGEGKRKRKRSGTNCARTAAGPKCSSPNESCAVPAAPVPKVLCRRSERGQKRSPRPRAAGTLRWLDPSPLHAALNPGQSSRSLALTGTEEINHCKDHGSSSTSRPKATKRRRKVRLEKVYTKGPLLGKGGYGSVYAGTRISDGLPVAIKYVSKAQSEEELDIPGQGGPLPLEVALMKQVNAAPPCPYVLHMLEWFDQPTRYVMVLERPEPCQDLLTFCEDQGGAVGEGLARHVLAQLLGALEHCWERGVLHRDVKPENLLIQSDSHQVKLFDFGCGDVWKNTAYKDFAGTLEYTPPEWFHQQQYLAWPATVWSLGITLYHLVCGCLPFFTVRESMKGRVRFAKGVSLECRQLIRWCLRTNAMDRPSLEQIQLHPWLMGGPAPSQVCPEGHSHSGRD